MSSEHIKFIKKDKKSQYRHILKKHIISQYTKIN